MIHIDLVLFAHNVEVKNKMTPGIISESSVNEFGQFWIKHQKDPLKGRDVILSSICPQVFGLYIVKLAVSLILAGGVEKKDGNSRIRGDSHLLLVGDPGTGKSQFLKFASKVCMRAVLTSGIGTTNAGLTVSAVKEGGKWQLEAGALVLADGGVCCIDEFSCIKEHDKTCIHEAMEQQTISVAKAGLVCSLSTKCSILAATNPKGKYDKNLSLSENIALASPLLSRFDIILVLLDTYDENWDKLVSSYILEGRKLSNQVSKESSWSLTKVRNYFTLIRNINPKVTVPCDKILQAYYKRQRSSEGRNFARTTPRLLQSLVRLAEGHARLMFRSEVLVIDAIIAIVLMESSMSGSAILDGLTTLHTSFPDDPAVEFHNKAKTVLKLLKLDELVEHCEDYKFCYQDLSVNSLLSKVSVLCDTTKNSYLSESFAYNENTSIEFNSESKKILDEGNFKRPFPLDSDFYTKDGQNSNFDSLHNTTKQIENCDLETDPGENGVEKCSTIIKKNMEVPINKDNLCDEISTLSDLRNTFCDEILQSQNTTLNPKSDRKRKSEDFIAELFSNSGTDAVEDYPSDKLDLGNVAGTSNLYSIHSSNNDTSLPPKVKKMSLEKPSEFKSFKRLTFQSSSQIKSVQITDNETEHSNKENLRHDVQANSVLPNSVTSEFFNNDELQTFDNMPLKIGKSLKNRKKNTHSEHSIEVKSKDKPVTNKLNSDPAENEQDLTKPSTSKNNPMHTEPNKCVNAFKEFAFKSRPSKKSHESAESETPKPTENVCVSETNVSSQNHQDRNTQSLQSAFKRIFSSSVSRFDDLDFDDPLFKI